jgi:hypothetical protein
MHGTQCCPEKLVHVHQDTVSLHKGTLERNSGRETQLGLIVLHPFFYEEGKALYQRQQAKLPLLK